MLKSAGVQLRESDVALLQERTEGWAAGLRLAAISLEGHTQPERFVAEFSGSDRTVAEYLLAEMLERQPADVRHLLLRTSIVDRISGPLGDVLTGTAGTEQTFHALEDANAFVVSLDSERTWFRYHYLFGICCAWNCAGQPPARCPSCTGAPQNGSPPTVTWSRPSATPRRPRRGLRSAAARR